MSAHTYSLRSKVSSSSLNTKTPIQSPLIKGTRSPRKGSSAASALQLKHVIGTTTSTPGGLSCCPASRSYAYCAGSVAVLANIDIDSAVSYRYFKARPTAVPINHTTNFYDSPSTVSTPSRKRSVLSPRRGYDDYGGGAVSRDWFDETAGQTWTARERIKTATCVSISTDGRILAVGETGYNPRVLIFSTAQGAPTDVPLSIISEHTIGVRSVAFSPDSRFLATLGDVNDGFLYIWQVNTKTGVVRLQSANKCTTNVCDMTWCGNTVVTVGTRHIKVWQASNSGTLTLKRRARLRLDDEATNPGPSTLQGRNCLLGNFANATFTGISTVSEDHAVVCADDGHLCLLDLSGGKTELFPIEKMEKAVAAISSGLSPYRVVWAGGGGVLHHIVVNPAEISEKARQPETNEKDARKQTRTSRNSHLRQSLGLSTLKLADAIALGCLDERVVCIDAEGVIRIASMDNEDLESENCKLSSHNGAVGGVQNLPKDVGIGSFFTWARNGEIKFWNDSGELVGSEKVQLDDTFESNDPVINELRVVRYSRKSDLFITGDQFGVIQLVSAKSWSNVHTVRAHSAEVNSIDMHDTHSLIATCGRDRMVQLFEACENQLELLQTLDDHISVVNQVLFSRNGSRLISCSSDRTVVVRERVERKNGESTVFAFISARTITMKAAPLSMAIMPIQTNILVVSTMDRFVVKVDIFTGVIISSFKVSDRDSDDNAVLNSICVSSVKPTEDTCLLAGYSSIDKSIRLYDLDKGVLLGRDAGHTEGVSDILVLEEAFGEGMFTEQVVVSTGFDSTIMMWSARAAGQPLLTPLQEISQAQSLASEPEKTPIKTSPASLPPLRRILSKLDIADFARQSSPTREVSPSGLRRKTSRLALSTSIEERDESTSGETPKAQAEQPQVQVEKRSPSPPPQQALVRPRKQRSRTEITKDLNPKVHSLRQSPSPPTGISSTPATPRHNARANNSRLRRPPSVPTDLRAQAVAKERRQSMSSTNDFGSIGMATEQACRMLKTYRKKLQASRGEIDLDDIEADLEAVLKTVRQKRAKKAKENDDEMNRLSTLLEKTSV